MKGDTALKVRCFVFVDNVAFSKLIEHRSHLGEKFFCRFLVRGVAKSPYRITSCFVVIFVTKPSDIGLTNPFL